MSPVAAWDLSKSYKTEEVEVKALQGVRRLRSRKLRAYHEC
jgi:hypothetical protein